MLDAVSGIVLKTGLLSLPAFAREEMEVWDDLFLSFKATKLVAGALSP